MSCIIERSRAGVAKQRKLRNKFLCSVKLQTFIFFRTERTALHNSSFSRIPPHAYSLSSNHNSLILNFTASIRKKSSGTTGAEIANKV
jgi:hypothetical protein